MASRNIITQPLHDQIIQIAYNNLDKINHDVFINPGQQHNTSVGNEYPDIIITNKNDNVVKFIIEVETSDSVNLSEALNQWIAYSKLGGTFYLLVPQDSRNLAELICVQNNIKARFGTYQLDQNRNMTIIYE